MPSSAAVLGQTRQAAGYVNGREPSGSIHRIDRDPGRGIRIKSSSSELAPGVDIKGDGGMFVAPPSVRADGEYRWLNNCRSPRRRRGSSILLASRSRNRTMNRSRNLAKNRTRNRVKPIREQRGGVGGGGAAQCRRRAARHARGQAQSQTLQLRLPPGHHGGSRLDQAHSVERELEAAAEDCGWSTIPKAAAAVACADHQERPDDGLENPHEDLETTRPTQRYHPAARNCRWPSPRLSRRPVLHNGSAAPCAPLRGGSKPKFCRPECRSMAETFTAPG